MTETADIKRILVLCTGNSCRSIIAEVLFNELGQGRFQAISAGSQPTGVVNAHALAVLQAHGHCTDGLASQSWYEHQQQRLDVIITVCDAAAGESCPLVFAPVPRVHWGLPDPAQVTGSAASIREAFESTYRMFKQHIDDALALPAQLKDSDWLQAMQSIHSRHQEQTDSGA